MENCLYCGTAREKITPPAEWLKDLRGLMDSSFGGVVDDLYVRVVALENAGAKMLLFTFDLDKVPWPKENIEKGAPHHGRVWWHQEWVADMCFDYLDKVLGREEKSASLDL